jgi:hypothetical protein
VQSRLLVSNFRIARSPGAKLKYARNSRVAKISITDLSASTLLWRGGQSPRDSADPNLNWRDVTPSHSLRLFRSTYVFGKCPRCRLLGQVDPSWIVPHSPATRKIEPSDPRAIRVFQDAT